MTDLQYSCLRVAVTLAKTEQIGKVSKLRQRLVDHGFDEQDINTALSEWAKHARRTNEAA